jgi:hypothetical protein
MKKYFWLFLILLLATYIACNNKNPTAIDALPFNIVIQTGEPGNFTPVAGVTVSGGVDWDMFSVVTNQYGIAQIPGNMRGRSAIIYKDNFLPNMIDRLDTMEYWIGKTRDSLQVLGEVEGTAVMMTSGAIATMNQDGVYRTYTYSSSSVLLKMSIKLNDSINYINAYRLYGDTLWLSSRLQGLYVYSIANIDAPILLFKIPSLGSITSFAFKDTLTAYYDYYYMPGISVVTVGNDHQVRFLSHIDDAYAKKMEIIDDRLFLLGVYSWPKVYDISNPALPDLQDNFLEPVCLGGFFYQRKLFLGPLQYEVLDYGLPANYKVRDLSTPSAPIDYSVFRANGFIDGLYNDTLAFGHSGISYNNGFIYKGSADSGYSVTASLACINSQPIFYLLDDNSIISWPYLVIGTKVCKYVSR